MNWTDRNAPPADVDHSGHEKLALESYEISASLRSSLSDIGFMADRSAITAKIDEVCSALTIVLRTWLTTASRSPQYEVYYFPLNPWQHLVHDYAPKWYIELFPVKYDELRVKVSGDVNVCPHSTIKWDSDEKPHVDFVKMVHGK